MGRQEVLPKLQAMVQGDTGNDRVSVSGQEGCPPSSPSWVPIWLRQGVCQFPQASVGRSEAKVGVGQGEAFGQGGLLWPPHPQPRPRSGPGTRKASFCGKR